MLRMRAATHIILPAVFLAATAGPVFAQFHQNPVARALERHQWQSLAGDGVTVFYRGGSFAERHRHMLLRSAEAALRESLAFLGESGFDDALHVFYVDSREQMEQIAGRPVSGLASTSEHGVLLVVNPDWRSFEVHEITHIVTLGRWGDPHPSSRWMIEGISIAADGWCRTWTVDQIARHLLQRDRLLPLRELFSGFRDLGEVPGGMYAASIIGFIRATRGIEAVRALWQQGSDDFEAAVGATVEDIEARWRDHLERNVDPAVDVDYDAIDEHGCG